MKHFVGLLGLVFMAVCWSWAGHTAPQQSPAAKPAEVFQASCSGCHQAPSAKALPDLKAWIQLLYTSGCPDVTIKLEETQRKAIKSHLEQLLKAPANPQTP